MIENYDSDGMFPVFGFGGTPNYLEPVKTSHCFPVNGNRNDPEVKGINGVLQVYKSMLPKIELSGPTYFGGIIEKFKEICTKAKD